MTDSEKKKLHESICKKLGFDPVNGPFPVANDNLKKQIQCDENEFSVLNNEELGYLLEIHYKMTIGQKNQ